MMNRSGVRSFILHPSAFILQQCALRGSGAGDSVPGGGEGGEEAVSQLLHLVPAVLPEEPPEEVMVRGQRLPERTAGRLPLRRRTLHVGEEEGDGAGRQRGRRGRAGSSVGGNGTTGPRCGSA